MENRIDVDIEPDVIVISDDEGEMRRPANQSDNGNHTRNLGLQFANSWTERFHQSSRASVEDLLFLTIEPFFHIYMNEGLPPPLTAALSQSFASVHRTERERKKKKAAIRKKLLKEIPKFSFHKNDREAVRENDCRICLIDFAERCSLKKLCCGHSFHSKCIDKWLGGDSSSGKCPLCNQKVLKDDDDVKEEGEERESERASVDLEAIDLTQSDDESTSGETAPPEVEIVNAASCRRRSIETEGGDHPNPCKRRRNR